MEGKDNTHSCISSCLKWSIWKNPRLFNQLSTPVSSLHNFGSSFNNTTLASITKMAKSKVENTNKGIVIREEPEKNHVNIPTQGTQLETKNDRGKRVDKRKDKLPFLSFLPRKKLPFVSNDDEGKDHCLTGSKSRSLEDELRGPLGYQAVFMPAPGQSPFSPAGGTSPIVGHPSRTSQSESVRFST